MSMEVIGINRVSDQGDIKAFADIKIETELGDVVIKGFRVVESRGRTFVGWPAKKGSDDKYHLTVYTNENGLKGFIKDAVMRKYIERD